MSQVLSSEFDPGLPSNWSSGIVRFTARVSGLVAGSPLWLSASGVFLLALSIRLVNIQQPLCENFIDRQVHTAMMARNLARGGSPFYPEIDIGPFPAYYMLEFPGYPALAAAVAGISDLNLDVAGRLVSSIALALACLVLFDLVRRHDGLAVGLLAGVTLAFMPVTIRYGRAFQPDATMISLLVAGVWSMDRWCERGSWHHLALAAVATSGALLLKVIAAYVLLPLAYLAWKRCGGSSLRRRSLWLTLAVMVLPAAAWYVHAWHVAATGETVSTPFWHAHKWISPSRFLNASTYQQLAYYVGLRMLTPIGVGLAVFGSVLRVGRITPVKSSVDSESIGGATQPRSMLFHVWLASLAAYLPILVRKLDHEHYYLALAPVAAVFMARALGSVASAPLTARCYLSGKTAAACLAAGLLACDLLACISTYRTPDEWRNVASAAAAAREFTPRNALVAGHSAVLFYADRRGFTFAYAVHEIDYLFGTWGERCSDPSPAALLEFYRDRGADYFVELLGTGRERNNSPFFDYVRSHNRVVHEEPGKYVVVALKG